MEFSNTRIYKEGRLCYIAYQAVVDEIGQSMVLSDNYLLCP